MGKVKRTPDKPVREIEVLVPVEPDKIYIYQRHWKLTQPIPFKATRNADLLQHYITDWKRSKASDIPG